MSSEPEDLRDPRPLSASLDGVLRSLRAGERKVVAGVFGNWEKAVGPQVAAHARPVKLDAGRLVVEVDEPAWATQLRYLQSDIINRIKDATGVELSAIEVRVSRPGGAPRW